MARIRITDHWCDPQVQEAYATVWEYVYCDQCGSFDIGHESRLPDAVGKALVVIIIVAFIGTLVSIWLFHDLRPLVLSIAIGILAFVLIGATGGQRCRKCGNEHFGHGNPLGYRDDDASVIDLPLGQRSKAIRREIRTTTE